MGSPSLADFDIGAVLGQGGMATVHRAVHRPTGEVVALKLMLAQVEGDPTFIERFRREALSTSSLRHDNICRVISWGHDDDKLFMALELIDGGSVRDLKQAFGGRLPQQLAAEIVAQLLDALAVAHAAGIVHRDLKPANLMLTRSGVVKLVDFGIAKAATDQTLTATGMLVGTPAFMSPEQVRGDKLDGRSDLFSTGLILHDLLGGRSPFYSDNPATSLMRVLTEEAPGLFDAFLGVDPVLEGVHARLTMKEPDARYADARAALAALKPYLRDVRARHPSLVATCIAEPQRMKRDLRREAGASESARARALIARHGPIPAAALALENATSLDRTLDDARELYRTVAPAAGIVDDAPADPRIDEAKKALQASPHNPGLLKRLADLSRATGRLRDSARYLKRYLRIRDDAAALQQLSVLLHGPGADPVLVSLTTPRLKTADIVAGIKTGGMPQLQDKKPARAPTLNVDRLTAQTARAPVVVVDGPSDTGGALGAIARAFGGWLYVLVPGLIVLSVLAVVASGVRGGVRAAQQDEARHAEGVQVAEEHAVWGTQRTSLIGAEDALRNKQAIPCIQQTTVALEGRKQADLVLDAYWLRAQCQLLLGDTGAARSDLETYDRYANVTDPRRDSAQTQLRALQAGRVPSAILPTRP